LLTLQVIATKGPRLAGMPAKVVNVGTPSRDHDRQLAVMSV